MDPAVITIAHELHTEQVDKTVTEDASPKTHAEILQFLERSYGLKPDVLKISELHWRFAIRSIIRGENLLVRGEAGCGKTLLATTLSKVLSRPFFYFNMGATQDPRSTLIGNTHFKKDEGTYVALSLFVQAIQTPNAVILLDELSRAHPEAHNILLTVLDKTQRYLRIDERPDTPTIRTAPGVSFVATANVGSEYTATRIMDRALVDRFVTLMLNPLSKADEIELLSGRFPTLPQKIISAIAEIAELTRVEVKSATPKIETIISTRKTVEMAELLYDGFSLEEAAETCIYPFYSDAGGPDSPLSFVKIIVQKYIKSTGSTAKPLFTADMSQDPLPWSSN